MDKLHKITGTWQGVYSFDAIGDIPNLQSVPFTLTVQQGWFGRFRGTVTDDASPGMPGTGVVKGHFSFPRIAFTKQMPVCYVVTPDRRIITLREYLIENGHICDRDVPHRPILYDGAFIDTMRAAGRWTIEEGQIPLGGGRAVKMGGSTGTWTLESRAA